MNRRSLISRGCLVLLGIGTIASCTETTGPGESSDLACGSLDPFFLADGGVGRDGIPALTDPVFVNAQSPLAAYIPEEARVIGVFFGDEALAIPHNLMYRHEIVNLNRGGTQIAVTYCPLTGSALAFDRADIDGAEFGVSGLLYQANLIMYDRSSPNSLWPQMFGAARCGPKDGQTLTRYPVVELTWRAWKSLYPNSEVVGTEAGGDYERNPYGPTYDLATNGNYLGFPIPRLDNRRSPKERVLGLPDDGRGTSLAFPFGAMAGQGEAWVQAFDYAGAPAVVFWNADAASAVSLRPVLNGQQMTFQVVGNRIIDDATGTQWSVTGRGVLGDLAGSQLEVIADSYVAFWLPWVAFNSGTQLMVE